MNDIVILCFTQPNCPPCYRLKDFINRLPSEQREMIEFVDFKTKDGERTALAVELEVELTPTLVVADETFECSEPDEEGIRACDFIDVPIEKIVGATNITTALPGIINNYILSE